MKRIFVWVLALILLLAGLPMSAAPRVASKAFTVGNTVYLDIGLGDIVIGRDYVQQNNEQITHKNKLCLTGTSTLYRVSVLSGANVAVTINDLYIQYGVTADSPFALVSGAKVQLTLTGRNVLEVTQRDPPALCVPDGASLTISGNGALRAENISPSGLGAGIGGSTGTAAGDITIKSGTVTAKSGEGAGIGGGWDKDSGNITITGGMISAESARGAGIGGGWNGSTGTVTVSGGTIKAFSKFGAGIGGGENVAPGKINILGGTVESTSEYGAGIGSGRNSSADGAGSVTLGKVKLTLSRISVPGGTITLAGASTLLLKNASVSTTTPILQAQSINGKGKITLQPQSSYACAGGELIAQGVTGAMKSKIKLGSGFTITETVLEGDTLKIAQLTDVYLVRGKSRTAMSFDEAVTAINTQAIYKDKAQKGKVAQARIMLRKNVETGNNILPDKPCTIDGQGKFSIKTTSSNVLLTATDLSLTGITLPNVLMTGTDQTLTAKNVNATTLTVRQPGKNNTIAASGSIQCGNMRAENIQLNKATIQLLYGGDMSLSDTLSLTGTNRLVRAEEDDDFLLGTVAGAHAVGKGKLLLEYDGAVTPKAGDIVYMCNGESIPPEDMRVSLGASLSGFTIQQTSGTTYTLAEKDTVAQVKKGKSVYLANTFADAVARANTKAYSGATVTLMKNAEITDNAVFQYPVTINLNGHTLSGSKSLVFGKTSALKNGTFTGIAAVEKGATLKTTDVSLGTLIGVDGAADVRGKLTANAIGVSLLTVNDKAAITLNNNISAVFQAMMTVRCKGTSTLRQTDTHIATYQALKFTGSGKILYTCDVPGQNRILFKTTGSGGLDAFAYQYFILDETTLPDLSNYRIVQFEDSLLLRSIFG